MTTATTGLIAYYATEVSTVGAAGLAQAQRIVNQSNPARYDIFTQGGFYDISVLLDNHSWDEDAWDRLVLAHSGSLNAYDDYGYFHTDGVNHAGRVLVETGGQLELDIFFTTAFASTANANSFINNVSPAYYNNYDGDDAVHFAVHGHAWTAEALTQIADAVESGITVSVGSIMINNE